MINGEGKGKENELRYSVSVVCLSAFWLHKHALRSQHECHTLGSPLLLRKRRTTGFIISLLLLFARTHQELDTSPLFQQCASTPSLPVNRLQ